MNRILHFGLLLIFWGLQISAFAQVNENHTIATYYNKSQPILVTKTSPTQFYLKVDKSLSGSGHYPDMTVYYAPNVIGGQFPFSDLSNAGNGPYLAQGSSATDSKVAAGLLWGAQRALTYIADNFTSTFPGQTWYGIDGIGTAAINLNVVLAGNGMGVSQYLALPERFLFSNTISATQNPGASLDLIGHELTHAIFQRQVGAAPFCAQPNDPSHESRAIEESCSDIMGVLIRNNVTGTDDWSFGADQGIGTPLRDFSFPKLYGQPSTYKGVNYDNTCGIIPAHTNDGVMNHWFYLLVTGGKGNIDDDGTKGSYNIVGIGRQAATAIFFKTLFVELKNAAQSSTPTFMNARNATLQAAEKLYGFESIERASVADAWNGVGVGLSSSQMLSSIPADGAKDVNPWMTDLKIEISPNINQGAFKIATDKALTAGTITTKILINPNDTEMIGGKLYMVIRDLILPPGTTCYWSFIATDINCPPSQQPVACDLWKTKLASGDNVRSFTTDSRQVVGLNVEKAYPWGGAQLLYKGFPPPPPSSNANIKYYALIFDGNKQLDYTSDIPINPNLDPNVVQTFTDPKLMLDAGKKYTVKWYASMDKPPVIGDPKNQGKQSEATTFITEIPASGSLEQEDVYPFAPPGEIPIPGLKTLNSFKCAFNVLNANKQLISPSIAIPSDGILNGLLNAPLNMATTFNIPFNNTIIPREDIQNCYYEFIPQAPPLTGLPGVTGKPGIMANGSYPLYIQWGASTRPELISPIKNETVPSEGTVTFKFHAVPYATKYYVEIASPSFVNASFHTEQFIEWNKSGDVSQDIKVPPVNSGFEWRVTSFKDNLQGATSEVGSATFSFGKTTLVYPPDGALDIPTENVTINFSNTNVLPGGRFRISLKDLVANGFAYGGSDIDIKNPGPQSVSFTLPLTLKEGTPYQLYIVPQQKDGTYLNDQPYTSISTFTTIASPSAKAHTITLTWHCSAGESQDPFTKWYGEQIIQEVIEVSTGLPPVVPVDLYVFGWDDDYMNTFNKKVDDVDVWSNITVIGWVLKGNLPSGNYTIKTKTKGPSACNQTLMNMDVDGTVSSQHPQLNTKLYDLNTFTVTVP